MSLSELGVAVGPYPSTRAIACPRLRLRVQAHTPSVVVGNCGAPIVLVDFGNRAQLNDRSDYVLKAQVGKVVGGSGALVQESESQDPNRQVGDLLATAYARWQHYQVLNQ